MGKTTRPVPIAEFIDIDEQLRKYQKTFLRELKANGKILGAQRQTNGPVSKYETVDDLKVREEVLEEQLENVCDGETRKKGKNSGDESGGGECKFNSSKYSAYSPVGSRMSG